MQFIYCKNKTFVTYTFFYLSFILQYLPNTYKMYNFVAVNITK